MARYQASDDEDFEMQDSASDFENSVSEEDSFDEHEANLSEDEEEREVLPLDVSDSDSDADAHFQFKKPKEKLDSKGWGHRRNYYEGEDSEDDEVAELEEEEALQLQKQRLSQLQPNDFLDDAFSHALSSSSSSSSSSLNSSTTEALTFSSSSSSSSSSTTPSEDVLSLLLDFPARLEDLKEAIVPLHDLAQSQLNFNNTAPRSNEVTKYLYLKSCVYLGYLLNLGVYVGLHCGASSSSSLTSSLQEEHMSFENKDSLRHHPVVSYLVHYQTLLQQLEDMEQSSTWLSEALEPLVNLMEDMEEKGMSLKEYLTSLKTTSTITLTKMDTLLSDSSFTEQQKKVNPKDVQKKKKNSKKNSTHSLTNDATLIDELNSSLSLDGSKKHVHFRPGFIESIHPIRSNTPPASFSSSSSSSPSTHMKTNSATTMMNSKNVSKSTILTTQHQKRIRYEPEYEDALLLPDLKKLRSLPTSTSSSTSTSKTKNSNSVASNPTCITSNFNSTQTLILKDDDSDKDEFSTLSSLPTSFSSLQAFQPPKKTLKKLVQTIKAPSSSSSSSSSSSLKKGYSADAMTSLPSKKKPSQKEAISNSSPSTATELDEEDYFVTDPTPLSKKKKTNPPTLPLTLRRTSTTPSSSLSSDEPLLRERPVSKAILKNRGLTPYRKKALRNPRVKHRTKYEAKMKKLKTFKRLVQPLQGSYGGERTGIKTHLTRSIKLQ